MAEQPVPAFAGLEKQLSEMTVKNLPDKEKRLTLLEELRKALVFVRDYDSPPEDVVREYREQNEWKGPGLKQQKISGRYALYSPTVAPNNTHYQFVDERRY